MQKSTVGNKSPNEGLFYWIVFITLLSPIFTDAYVIIMATIAKHFSTTKAVLQRSFSAIVFTSLIANLIYPTIFKKIGIKNTIKYSNIITAVAAIVTIFSDNLYFFLTYICILALSIKANTVSCYPLVRSLSESSKTFALHMSKMNFFRSFVGIVVPLVTGVLTDYLSWKIVFIIITLYSTLILIHSRNLVSHYDKTTEKTQHSIYKKILSNKTFLFFTALRMLIAAGTFAYIVELPFLLHDLHYSPTMIGVIFFIINSGFVFGTMLSTKLLQIHSPSHSATVGLMFILIGGVSPLLIKIFFNQVMISILIIFIYSAGTRMLDPLITSKVLFLFPKQHTPIISGVFFVFRALSATIFTYILSHTKSDITLYIALCISSMAILLMLFLYQLKSKKPTF